VEHQCRCQRSLPESREARRRRVRGNWATASIVVTLSAMWVGVPVAQASATALAQGGALIALNSERGSNDPSLSGHSGSSLATLAISVVSLTVTVGGTIRPTVTINSGLASKDTATVTGTTFTYVGLGTTVYAKSTTTPTAVGTYSVSPSAATVTISPSTDAGNYSKTYIYIDGTLVIKRAVVKVVGPPRARRVVGDAIVGERRTLTIIGSNFSADPRVSSNGPGALVYVYFKSANRIVLSVSVNKSSHPGSHIFTITTSAGKRCRIGYVTRY
jgi:hypothetical protein